jgi:hypothetical protein
MDLAKEGRRNAGLRPRAMIGDRQNGKLQNIP